MYARIQNNTVSDIIPRLPTSYSFADGSTTGNFDLLDAQIHALEGYLPYSVDAPAYDPEKEQLVFDEYVIHSDHVVGQYVKESIPLATIKATKLAALETLASSKLASSTFTFAGETFNFHHQAANDASQLQSMLGIGMAFPANFSWTQTDGEEMTMDAEGFADFASAMATHKLMLTGTHKYHAASIKALTDVDDVLAYDITAGW